MVGRWLFSVAYYHNLCRLSNGSAHLVFLSSIISSNLDQVLIRIIHIKCWSRTSGARLNSRTVVVTDRMERVAIWDSVCFHPGECVVKVQARQSKSKMFIPASAPWCYLQSEVVVNS